MNIVPISLTPIDTQLASVKVGFYAGHTSVHVKAESEFSAPIGDILKQHAADFSLDSDLGATRLNSAISQHGYSITAAAGVPRLPETTGHLSHADEESISLHHVITFPSPSAVLD